MLHLIKAQQFYTDLSVYQQCKFLQKIVEFKDFSRLLSDLPVLFKADLIFKESPLNSSTFQACVNPALRLLNVEVNPKKKRIFAQMKNYFKTCPSCSLCFVLS